MNEALQFASVLKDLGGWGVAAIVWYIYRKSDAERIRYRDMHEKFLLSVPKLTDAIERLERNDKASSGNQKHA